MAAAEEKAQLDFGEGELPPYLDVLEDGCVRTYDLLPRATLLLGSVTSLDFAYAAEGPAESDGDAQLLCELAIPQQVRVNGHPAYAGTYRCPVLCRSPGTARVLLRYTRA